MVMTIENFLQLPITTNFKVVAGERYLKRPMQNVEILDFEFMEGFEVNRHTMFSEASLVLSSLLFAKDDEQALFRMIDELTELKVSCFAFKPVIYTELPPEVLHYAESKKLPILMFGGDEFFEDIIFQAMDYRNKTAQIEFLESTIASLMENKLAANQQQSLIKQMNRSFEEYIMVMNIKSERIANENLFRFEPFLRKGLICRYEQSIFIIMTHQQYNFDFLEQATMIKQLLNTSSLSDFIGYSQIHKTSENFATALHESYYASIFAEINSEKDCRYSELKNDQLLIENYRNNSHFTMNYVTTYLAKIIDDIGDNNLLNTAITYILTGGNIKETADLHFCHQNTIRYRMTKIRQLIDERATDFQFYEHLSVAIKLYLLHKYTINRNSL